MDKFLDTYDNPKLNQVCINHLNRSVTQNEIKATIKILPKKRSGESDGFSPEINQTFKEEQVPTLFKLFHKIERKHCPTYSMKPVSHSSQNQTRIHPKGRTKGQSP
jgi:hypothetical protein